MCFFLSEICSVIINVGLFFMFFMFFMFLRFCIVVCDCVVVVVVANSFFDVVSF